MVGQNVHVGYAPLRPGEPAHEMHQLFPHLAKRIDEERIKLEKELALAKRNQKRRI